jgi:hypothetical protein
VPALPVTPSPRFPREQILRIVRTAAEVPAIWVTLRRGFLAPRPATEKAWIFVGLSAYQSVGVDEVRQVYAPPPIDQNQTILVGQRQFTLTLRAESLDTTLEAFDLLERVRFRMRSATIRALMTPTIALRDFAAMVPLGDETVNLGGMAMAIQVATLDIRMACVVGADPQDLGEENYIASAEIPPGVVGGNLLP